VTDGDRARFELLTGEVLFVDPYTGPPTLERLSFFRNADQVRFLTWKIQNENGTMMPALAEFQRENPKFEIRRLPGRALHARYVIAGDRLIHLGHSAQGGRHESVVTDTGALAPPEQIARCKQEFEEKWDRACPVGGT